MTNTEKKKLVVTLTSYPRRTENIHRVIDSIIDQTIKVDEIILYLSILEFPQRELNLPNELLSLLGKRAFKIEWVEENLKSHKKYYYVLKDREDAIVITVDDDTIYAKTMIYDLLKIHERYPSAVVARRVRIILKDGDSLAQYNQWDGQVEEYADVPRMDLCAIGVGGVLYPPGCASHEWFQMEKIKEYAENQDDLWLKYNEIKNGIPVIYVKNSECDMDLAEDRNEESLSSLNMYGGANDICIKKLFTEEELGDISKEWFAELLQQEEYILKKKQFYSYKMRSVFNDSENEPFYLFGAGRRAVKIMKMLSDFELIERIKCILVSDRMNNPLVLEGVQVCSINEVQLVPKAKVLCGVSDIYADEIAMLLKQYDCEMIWLDLDAILRFYTF